MKAYETALAYSNVILDMSRVAFPDSEYWETLSITISSNLSTYWKPYADFAQTTLSDSDARMRRFFALDYGEKRQGNCISVHIDGFDKAAYFVLKLNRETVDQVTGGEVKYLNHGFYLLEASEPDVQITVKEKSTFIY